jgi:AraC-like DNA-binding protein
MTLQYNRYYKYLTAIEEDKKWGIFLSGAGHVHVEKNTEYPFTDDPSHHYFNFATGRRLSEYQILYISRGEGYFESENTNIRKIKAGDVFILFPNIWHRFKPDESIGWDEYWVEFDGDFIEHFRSNEFLNPNNPVVSVGLLDALADDFMQIINLINEERPGFQYIASGILLHILGQILAAKKYQLFEGKKIEIQIKEAKLIIHENMHTTICQKDISNQIGMGYSLYRKKFKEYTGISPTQYQINLKVNKAKDLLITTNGTLKEIAENIGFDSPDYFFRLFKKKTGFTPSEFRDKNVR